MATRKLGKKPKIETPLPDFLQPVFQAYKRNKIEMAFEKVENGIVYITVDKKACGG